MSCWKPEFGASAVDIQPVSEGEGEAYYLAHYLLKVPAEVKMLENRANGPRLKGTEKGLRPEFAARLLELLSQVELDELIGSVGTGREIRTAALRRLRFWHRSRRYWSKGQLPTYLHEEPMLAMMQVQSRFIGTLNISRPTFISRDSLTR